MSIIQGTAKGGATSFYDFPIGDSLRFDGSSYLSRTPTTAGNRKTWTWSGWVKRTSFGDNDDLFGCYTGTLSDTGLFSVRFSSDSTLRVDAFTLSWRKTLDLYRDSSSWYHIVVYFDTTETAPADRIKLYVNGKQLISFDTSNTISLNTDYPINSTNSHYISLNAYTTSGNEINGYMANIQFIDGQALDPYFFGETKDNIWVPYNAFSTAGSGTATASDGDTATDSYGTNGFHLDFADSSNIGNDVSGNNNDWTVN